MGRNAVPSALRPSEDASHRPPNEREPVFEPILNCDPPEGLTEEGCAEWERLAEPLADEGLLTVADLAAFEGYCSIYGHARVLETEIARVAGKGSLLASLTAEAPPGADDEQKAKVEKSRKVAGVTLDLMKQHRMLVKGYVDVGGKFGLNPSARATLVGKEDEAASGWGKAFGDGEDR